MMNYLVAVDIFFPDQPSGAGRVAWDIAQMMRDQGHCVTIFCRKLTDETAEFSEYDGVQVIRFAYPKTISLDPLKLYKQETAGLKVAEKYLPMKKWDLVHIHIPLFGKIVYRVLGKGPKYVYTVHSPLLLEQKAFWLYTGVAGKIKWCLGKHLLRRLEGNLLIKVDKIHTLSNFTKDTINNFYGVGDKVSVIPHWCRDGFHRKQSKTEARNKLDLSQDASVLFSVRRLIPRMGLDVAIKAVASILKEKQRLYYVIAGSGPQEKSLKDLVRSLGVSKNITFLGRINDNFLKMYYEASDIFIMPTRRLECFGLPVLESLAYGLPVISTDVAALPELLKPILPDYIVPADNVEVLGEKIKGFLDKKLKIAPQEKLVKYINQHYGREVILPRIREFLES